MIKKISRYLIFAVTILICILSGCKKNVDSRIYTIKGKLLESSSNPIPVKNYQLTLHQNAILSFMGSFEEIEQSTLTDNEGNFGFSYSLNSGTGVVTGNTNPGPLYINSHDTLQFRNLYPEFRAISARVDTNFNTFYLYKKISRVVRKVQFDTPLNAGETLEVITSDASGAKYKNLTGPILAGTLLVVDTLEDYKISRLDLQSKKYYILSVLKKPMYQKDLTTELPIGDETYREILMKY